MESRRQQQVGRLIQRFLGDIFIRNGVTYYGRGMVTVSKVRMTPDLKIARIYVSIFNAEDKEVVMQGIDYNHYAIKNELAKAIRNKVRVIPALEFFLDDTLDEVMKLETLFNDLKKKAIEDPKIDKDDYKEEV